MADRRTKQQLRDELRMVYEENDVLKLRIAALENNKELLGVAKRLEDLFAAVKATQQPSEGSDE
jgi:hypothetical protein